MVPDKNSYLKLSFGSRVIFLFLLGLWSTSQLISVLVYLPSFVLALLYNLKNILGAILVAWSLLVILSQFMQRKVLHFDKHLFFFALIFPFYVTIIDIARVNISWQEVLLYWLWVAALYLLFPALLQDKELRRKAIKVVFLTNLLVLVVGISLGILTGRYYMIEHGDRMVFGFMHPNYYCTAWLVIFVTAFDYLYSIRSKLLKIAALSLMLGSIIFMLLASSRNNLVASMVMIACYIFINKRRSFVSRFMVIIFMLLFGMLALLFVNPKGDTIDQFAHGRLSIWRMTLEANLSRASALDYLLGLGAYKIKGFGSGDSDKMGPDQDRFAREHVDNAYLGMFLQHGLIGLFLFYMPLLGIMRRTMVNARSAADELLSRQARIAFSCWIGILIQMTATPIIPSFGNVINIFILVFMAPVALKSPLIEPITDTGLPIGSSWQQLTEKHKLR